MILLRNLIHTFTPTPGKRLIGPLGSLIVFFWTVSAISLASHETLPWVWITSLCITLLLHPKSFRRIARPGTLMLILFLALPSVFLSGAPDRHFLGVRYSAGGLEIAGQLVIRIIVILLAAEGLTSTVDISAIAGLLERLGMHGLGFSIGIALNLLPVFQQSSLNAWCSMWMRGGLRKNRIRGLRMILMTIITNALRRAEEIALAAEVRAYSPMDCPATPIHLRIMDLPVALIGIVTLAIIIWLR